VELVGAFTSAFKKLDPIPQFKATAKQQPPPANNFGVDFFVFD
jgi:hypothetical protein